LLLTTAALHTPIAQTALPVSLTIDVLTTGGDADGELHEPHICRYLAARSCAPNLRLPVTTVARLFAIKEHPRRCARRSWIDAVPHRQPSPAEEIAC
jgi:hypothetical protein